MNLKFWERKKDITDEILIQRSEPEVPQTQNAPEEPYSAPVGGLNFASLLGSGSDPLRLSAFYAALTLISNSIASVPIVVSRNDDNGKVIDKEHSLNYIFNHGTLSYYQMMKRIVSDIYLHGNGYMYIERKGVKVTGLRYLPSERVNIMYDEAKDRLYYKCSYVSAKLIAPENIIHFYRDAEDGITGKPITFYAKRVLSLTDSANSQAENFFDSGCAIQGILSSSTNLTDKQKAEIRQNWKETHGKGKGGIAVLPAQMKYESIGTSASDSQLLETREFGIQEIARMFNINPVLLGDLKSSNYKSLEDAQLELVSHTLLPLIRMMEDELNRKLVLPNENIVIGLDENYLLRGDRASTASYLSQLVRNGIMTINEARNVLDLSHIDGADDLFIPYTDLAANTVTGEKKDKNTETQNND